MNALKKVAFILVVFFLIGIAGVMLYIRHLERQTIFHPSKVLARTPDQVGVLYQDVRFQTADGLSLHGWYAHSAADAPTLLMMHGNAGNISNRVEKLAHFHDMGLNVFLFDYRGYGRSEGHPTEEGVYEDVKAAFDHVAGRDDVDPDHIIAYGASLGGAIAIDLAVHRPVQCLIVDSTFSSAREMAEHLFPHIPSFLVPPRFDSLGKISELDMPKLFIHSRDDTVVPFFLGERLFQMAPEPKVFVEVTGDHNDNSFADGGAFTGSISQFIQEHCSDHDQSNLSQD